jgi:hypothetical protein
VFIKAITPVSSANAPERFAAWLQQHRHPDLRCGWDYNYHSRSDSHSEALCEMVIQDLLYESELMRDHAVQGKIAAALDRKFESPKTGKKKKLDLAVGRPSQAVQTATVPYGGIAVVRALDEVFIATEAKAAMTEHIKAKPRIYDELSSSHEIVHDAKHSVIATGIAVVNFADSFVSPLRQNVGQPKHITRHPQPHYASQMVEHLRKLHMRPDDGPVGFDAFATIVISCANEPPSPVLLITDVPAPQPVDRDHYAWFLRRIIRRYEEQHHNL